MTRQRLPDRRPSATRVIRWVGSDDNLTEYAVTVGFFLDGRPGEVFCSAGKVGSTMRTTLEDACVVVSLALQHGVTPAQLVHSMARVPVSVTTSRPASIVGAIAEALTEVPSEYVTVPK